MATIRSGRPDDRDAVLDVVRAAFSAGGADPQEEVSVVTATWDLDAAPPNLELVAVEDDTVVGYVVAARGRIQETEVLGIAPLAVVPLRQGEGIGTQLMGELTARAEAEGWPLLLLLGDPGYYQRFGFEPAARLGITYAALGGPDRHFQARKLRAYDAAMRGAYTYCWETPA